MRIICEQCQTKYIVPDEKIEKNVLRMTCQKCGHVITTRVEKVAETADASSSTLGKWRSTTLNTPRRLQNETPIWYYSYNGESFGPYTELELKERLLTEKMAAIAEQCFVWRKSFSSWKPVLEVEPFASALLMPPPPPSPVKPLPKNEDDSMPPLFSSGKSSVANPVSPSAKSSPDLVGLKQRLQKAPSGIETKKEDRHGDSFIKFTPASSLFGKVEQNANSQDEVPTHTQIPAVESLDIEVDEETPGDTTRVGAPSPFFSFQSLDAISPEIKSESKGIGTKLAKPFPSISALSVTGTNSSSAKVSENAFGASSVPSPNISSLLGTKPSTENKAPRFAGLRSMASGNASNAADEKKVINAASALKASPAAAESKSSEKDLPDFKEDIGAIVGNSNFVSEDAKTNIADLRNDSISSWLPSQSDLRLDSKLDGFSVSDISVAQKVIDKSSAESSLPSFGIGNVIAKSGEDVKSSDSTAVKSAPNFETSDVLPDIDLEDVSESGDSSVLPDIDMESSSLGEAVSSSTSSDILPDIDMDEDSQLIFEKEVAVAKEGNALETEITTLSQDDVKIESEGSDDVQELSAQQLLSATEHTSDSKALSSEADLGVVDLEDENSQLNSKKCIEPVTDDASDKSQKSGLVESEVIVADKNEDSGIAKARVSHQSLDEIAARHSEIIAESEKLEQGHSNESDVSENSMLIQLEHFQKSQEKDKHKTRMRILVVVLVFCAVIAIIGVVGYFEYVKNVSDDEEQLQDIQTGFAQVSGSKISSDELKITVPEDDFEILDMNPVNAKISKSSKNSGSSGAGNSGSTEAAAEAIYGANAAKEQAPVQPSVRQDGRANVVLQGANSDFGNTAAVQGSKYAVKGGSRELFAGGLKRVTSSVQDCSRRVANKGNVMPPKIYLNLVIEPNGKVSSYEIQDANVPDMFNKCLESKKDSWNFTPFEGSAVKIKQAFILG